MSQFFKIFITVLNVLWILAVIYAMSIDQQKTKAFRFFALTLIYTMAMNLLEIWK